MLFILINMHNAHKLIFWNETSFDMSYMCHNLSSNVSFYLEPAFYTSCNFPILVADISSYGLIVS